MDLEFITAVLNHSKVSEMVDQLNNYESAFVQLFDNMIIQLKVTSDKSDIRTTYSMLQAAPIYINNNTRPRSDVNTYASLTLEELMD